MGQEFVKSALALAVLASLPPASAVAESDSPSRGDALLEEIVVEGFRGSLIRAKDLKREAVGTQDSIIAEDIADFPDLNLADALQRIPGVAITREGGEGRQISLRGLGPGFTQVQLNGMEALGTSSSPMDSRGSINRSRAFDFNIFAAELFNQVDVKKSFAASMDEGGIGGTVNLVTAKPFDYGEFRVVGSGQLGQNSLSDGTSPRFAGLVSNTWGDFGALFSIAASERAINEQGYNTYRWRQLDAAGSDLSALPADEQDMINNKDLRFSRGSRYSVFENDQRRLGTTLALQYKGDTIDLGLDVLHGKLENDRGEFHLQSRGYGSTALGCAGPAYAGEPTCARLTEIEYNAGDEVIFSRFEDTAIHSESRNQFADTTVDQVVVNGTWQASDVLLVKGMLGSQSSDFETDSAKVYLETFGDMTIDYRNDRFYGSNTYGFDPTDASLFRYHEIDLSQDAVENTFDTVKFDLEYALDHGGTLRSGISLKEFGNRSASDKLNNLLQNEWSEGSVSDLVDPDFVYTNSAHRRQNWVSVDVDDVLDYYKISRSIPGEDIVNRVEEETLGAYVQYDFALAFGQTWLRGNAGVRHYDTDITSYGTLNDEPVAVTKQYSGTLPSVNLAWELNDQLLWRASVSKNLTRPSLGALSATGTVTNDPASVRGLSIVAGNPGLEPFESINFETSLEYYFDNIGYAAISYFDKSIDNFILTETYLIRYGDTGYPLNFLGTVDENGSPQTADTLYTVIQPQNMDKSDISGWELSFQRDLDFLPEPFSNLGIITNYTYADGQALYRNVANSGEDVFKNFPGLSEHSGNFTVYYEADSWGARVASAYRSDYISTVEAGNSEEDERGFHGTTYVDFSAFYQVSEQLKLTFEGNNLTDEREEQYSDSSDRLYNTTVNGRTLYLGATYDF
ncbi:TonB-dependent receptor [Microbulbifer elongatus]|uniref:TonB-dependent receptor n=1 Tax=Microbulbifer elongatus TaxID=86173 RepID=UPI001E4CA3EA|nr:TonB-dependent receptor [Microbulbifer elongatus]